MIPVRQLLKPTQLRLIAAVGENGQLLQAASALGMSQPAASRMLTEIEARLGVQLFDRQPRGMVPTEAGRVICQRADLILRDLGELVTDVRDMRDGLGGKVRVGAVTGPAVDLLVAAVRDLRTVAPRADITVEVLPSRDLLTHLVAGEIDFVLARPLPEFDSRDFVIAPMSDEKVCIIARAGHPLARAAKVALTDLMENEWIIQQRGTPIREALMAAFTALGLCEPANIVNCSSLLFALAYLAQTDAVTPVTREVVNLLTSPPLAAGLVSLNLPADILVSPYSLMRLRRRDLSSLASRLQALVLQRQQLVAGETTMQQQAP